MKAALAAILMLHGCQRPESKVAAPAFQTEPVGLRVGPRIILRDTVPLNPEHPAGPIVILQELPKGPFVILL